MNHDHNRQVREMGRCQTCGDGGPNLTAVANPNQAIDARHVARDVR